MADLLDTLAARGLLQDATPGLAERLRAGPLTAYVGFDPTAESLHVGNLVPVMGLAWLQRHGHTPIVLVGGGTGMVGDPSGKRTERPVLPPEEIDRNARAIRRQLERFLSFEGANAARMRDNAEWLRGLGLLDFLRDTGKHFTLGYMLQKESVRSRLETGISFTEFSYMLVQAYDFWHLWRAERCELQMGGSDQWGNITAGIELIGRRERAQAHGLVFPLVTTASGAKFGKSEAGAVWLDPARTSPYQFYQFWVNADDRDAEYYLKLFTFLPLDEIARVMAAQRADPGARAAQHRLAAEVTALVHGERAAANVREAGRLLFAETRWEAADPELLEYLRLEMPVAAVPASAVADGLTVVDALVHSGLASSKGDARRGIQQGGFSMNGERIASTDRRVDPEDLLAGRYAVFRKGKKHYAMLVVER